MFSPMFPKDCETIVIAPTDAAVFKLLFIARMRAIATYHGLI